MHADATELETTLRKQGRIYESYLAEFEAALSAAGSSSRSIRRHMRNASCFLTEYLLYEDDNSLEMGCYLVDDFMEGYVIEHCSWASPAAIEQSGTSLVRFYRCMLEAHHVDEDALDELEATIDAQMPLWKEECEGAARRTELPGDINALVAQSLRPETRGTGSGTTDEGEFRATAYRGTASDTAGAASPQSDPSPREKFFTNSKAETKGSAQRAAVGIDQLALALLYLCSQNGESDALTTAFARLRSRGLITGTANDWPKLTTRGEEEARAALAGLEFDAKGFVSNS